MGCQRRPAAATGASRGLWPVLRPNTISATNTGRHTTSTISTYSSKNAPPPPWEAR